MLSGLESPWHILLLLVALVVLFGPKRLPEIGRSLGHGLRGFKDAVTGADEPPEASARARELDRDSLE